MTKGGGKKDSGPIHRNPQNGRIGRHDVLDSVNSGSKQAPKEQVKGGTVSNTMPPPKPPQK